VPSQEEPRQHSQDQLDQQLDSLDQLLGQQLPSLRQLPGQQGVPRDKEDSCSSSGDELIGATPTEERQDDVSNRSSRTRRLSAAAPQKTTEQRTPLKKEEIKEEEVVVVRVPESEEVEDRVPVLVQTESGLKPTKVRL